MNPPLTEAANKWNRGHIGGEVLPFSLTFHKLIVQTRFARGKQLRMLNREVPVFETSRSGSLGFSKIQVWIFEFETSRNVFLSLCASYVLRVAYIVLRVTSFVLRVAYQRDGSLDLWTGSLDLWPSRRLKLLEMNRIHFDLWSEHRLATLKISGLRELWDSRRALQDYVPPPAGWM